MDQYQEALSKALQYLKIKLRTEMEVRKRLDNLYPQSIVDNVVNKLKEMGFINDSNYVECFIRDRLKLNPWGKKKIKIELQKKGIDPYLIEEHHLYKNFDEAEVIKALLKKRFKGYELENASQRARVISFFYRRGFLLENIHSALKNFTEHWSD